MELALEPVFTRRLGREETLEQSNALDAFLRDVEKRAFRMAVMIMRDADEALDVVQDAMVKLVTRYGRRPSEEWRPLFYRILKNRIRDWQRRRIVRTRVVTFFGGLDDDDALVDPVATAPGPSEDNPLAEAESSEALAALGKALSELPARQREAFMLRNFEGLDVAETALAMGCSEGSVKTHHARAVSRLRQLLGDRWS